MGTIASRKGDHHHRPRGACTGNRAYLCCSRPLISRGADKLGKGTKAVYDLVRREVSFMETDRAIYKDMNKIFKVLKDGEFVEAVEKQLVNWANKPLHIFNLSL